MDEDIRRKLVDLSRKLGSPEWDAAVLAEGNASAWVDEGSFLVKASGHSMRKLVPGGLVRVRFGPVLAALDALPSDDDIRTLLKESTISFDGKTMPSVETFMHAWLLSLPDVRWVAHTHPTPLISLLALPRAAEISQQRLFPDEIVCCGPATPFVHYEDPGLQLAVAIRTEVEGFIRRWETFPRTIWLQNHGLIALGKTQEEVESSTQMAIKSARAWIGALATGEPICPLPVEAIERIRSRPDEHYRQRLLWNTS